MYLYIFDDGSMKQWDEPPSSENLQFIGDGSLNVVRAVNGYFEAIDSSGNWSKVEESSGTAAEDAG